MLTREALLGANDLREKVVKLPSLGEEAEVRVKALSAAYSNEAMSKATEIINDGNQQHVGINTKILECLQVLHGLSEPKLNSLAEAETFMKNCGPAARAVVNAIDELSGVDKESIEEANARFQNGEANEGTGGAVDSEPESPDGGSDS